MKDMLMTGVWDENTRGGTLGRLLWLDGEFGISSYTIAMIYRDRRC